MNRKLAKVIRVLTVAPLLALVSLCVLKAIRPEMFRGFTDFCLAVLFLTVLPLLAYPLQPVMPGFKDKGRDGQRQLAIWMAVLGYVLGIASAFILQVSRELLLIYCVYLLSGLLILFFSKGLKIKASGHACGIAGPLAFLVYFVGLRGLLLLPLYLLACWASLAMGRHKWSELLLGTLIPVATLFLSIALVSLPDFL